MNKTIASFIIVILLTIGYLLDIDIYIQKKISIFKNNISEYIISTKSTLKSTFDKYLNQANYIEKLEDENKNNRIYKIKYMMTKNRLDEQNILLNLNYDSNLTYIPVKALSYLNINDTSKIVMSTNVKLEEKKIYPLITYDGYSCGIVLNKQAQNIGYLNNNPKCNYTVFIGDEKAPGITHGVDEFGNLLINYIPLWKNIKVGDEIITSGMDDIFPFGVKVGRVMAIDRGKITQNVTALSYANYLGKRFFYLIKH